MIDLFPEQVIQGLRGKFGARFDTLADDDRVALALAASEGTVNHARLATISSSHTVDLSRTLQRLTQLGMLESSGGRGAVYHLPGQDLPTPDEVFGPHLTRLPEISTILARSSQEMLPSSSDLGLSSSDLGLSSSDLGLSSSDLMVSSSGSSSQRDGDGYLLTGQLSLPVIDDLTALSSEVRARLEAIAQEPRSKKKIDHVAMEQVLLNVCAGHYVTLQCLAGLVNRKPDSLRNQYLSPMVRSRTLSLAFPTTPTHERQAYCATCSLPTSDGDSE
jgi:hypothetical protein